MAGGIIGILFLIVYNVLLITVLAVVNGMFACSIHRVRILDNCHIVLIFTSQMMTVKQYCVDNVINNVSSCWLHGSQMYRNAYRVGM